MTSTLPIITEAPIDLELRSLSDGQIEGSSLRSLTTFGHAGHRESAPISTHAGHREFSRMLEWPDSG